MPSRPNIENVRINLMRKNEIFVEGYPIPLVSVFTDDLISNQETYDVFGFEQQLSYTIIDGANLRMEGVNDATMQIFYDLATGQNPFPYATGGVPPTRGYVAQESIRLNVLRNLLNADSDGYEQVQFWDNWAAVIRNPAGGPRERGNIVLDGRCKTPIVVYAPVNKKIVGTFDVVPLTYVGAQTKGTGVVSKVCGTGAGTVVQIPAAKSFRNVATYALAVEAQCCDGAGTGTARGNVNYSVRLPVSAAMVDSSGNVNIALTDVSPFGLVVNQAGLAAGNKTIVTHAFVTYILEPPAGTPAGFQSGRCILNDAIPSTAKYEAP